MLRFCLKVALATLIPKLVNETYEYIKKKDLKGKIKQKRKELQQKRENKKVLKSTHTKIHDKQ